MAGIKEYLKNMDVIILNSTKFKKHIQESVCNQDVLDNTRFVACNALLFAFTVYGADEVTFAKKNKCK